VTSALSAKVDVPLAYEQRADAAAAVVLRELLTVIAGNVDGAIEGSDPEFLHRLRIAVRRSRTVQRQLAAVFDPFELPGFRSEFRWLQRATGEARDLDVYVEDFDSLRALLPEPIRADLDPLRLVLVHWQLAARAEMAGALCSLRASNLLADWDQSLESLVTQPLEDRPSADRPIGVVAGKRIRKVYKRIVAMGRAIDERSPAEDYHELRKTGKELRYLLDLFGLKLFDPEVVAAMVKSLKALQDVLGRHQDREIQIAMLFSLAGEVGTLPGGGAACLAMGILIERLRTDERAARAEFGERFELLASESERALFRQTFV
jgi:CHAD domain-containing protein